MTDDPDDPIKRERPHKKWQPLLTCEDFDLLLARFRENHPAQLNEGRAPGLKLDLDKHARLSCGEWSSGALKYTDEGIDCDPLPSPPLAPTARRRQIRSKSLLLGCLVAAVLSAPAGAKDLRLAGKFAFRTDVSLDKASCTRLDLATASRLASSPYRCERAPLSSGKTALLCSRPGSSGGHLIFDTKAACDSERKDEANAE